MAKKVCDMNCLSCKFSDCINTSRKLTVKEYDQSRDLDTQCREVLPPVDMTRYIHKREPREKEIYETLRNREYEKKRYEEQHDKRLAQKKKQYEKYREEKIAYQKSYYESNKEEIKVRQKERYEANKEEINRKRREKRKEKKDADNKK